jgi:hypothetical protein
VPPRNQSEGFSDCNQHLGNFWTNLTPDIKDIYDEDRFYTLGKMACGPSIPPQKDEKQSLTDEEITHYLPIFKENVNLAKVEKDLGRGKFGPDIPTANQNKGIKEVDRIDNDVSILFECHQVESYRTCLFIFPQLQLINIRYGVQYHLMACSWNPRTRNDKAHWENETSSCDDWLHISSQKHLLEVFVRETIKAEKSKPIEKIAQPSDLLKMRLTSTLNGLVSKWFSPASTFQCY